MMMNNKFILSIFLYVTLSTVYAEVPDIQEGLWEVSSEASITGMPMQMPAVTTEQCYTKQSMNPENILQNNNCQMNEMEIKNNLASWSMTCQQEGMTMQGVGNIQYKKTSFSGTFDMTMSGSPQGTMNMKTKLTGRYIGKCP